MEKEENSRDWEKGEHVLIEGLIVETTGVEYPIGIGDTTDEDVVEALTLNYWADKGVVQVRGDPVPTIPGVDVFDEGIDINHVSHSLGKTTLSLSQNTQQIHDNESRV